MQNDANTTKRQRHVPVKGAANVYKSQRADGKWTYEVRHPRNARGQRLFEVVGPRLDLAKARAREVHGETKPVLSVGTTLAQVVEDWKRARVMRPRSAQCFDQLYRLHIEPYLSHRKVRDLDKAVIQAWVSNLRRVDGKGDLATGTQRLIVDTLNVILAHAVEMGVINAVPKLDRRVRPKPSPGRTRVLTTDEERALLMYCGAFKWLRPIIIVTRHQALRLGEVCGLQWEDVNFADGTITIRHNLGRDRKLGPTKGGHIDTIPFMPAAREALMELRLAGGRGGFIFRNGLGGPRMLKDVQRAYAKAVERAGLNGKGVCFHTLRHTGISRLANNSGVPLVQVRDFARHTNLAVTMGYMHADRNETTVAAMAEAMA